MIDKKKLFKSLIIISLLIIIIVAIIQVRNTLARYETTANTVRDVDVAFWIVDNSFQTQRLLIDEDIYPRTAPYTYSFTVSNFKDSKKAETDLEYSLVITTTTNLPLSYTIQKNGTTFAAAEDLYQDEDGTFYRELALSKTETDNFILEEGTSTTDTYILNVTFPLEYNANLDYADLMESIRIDLSAKQVIGEEG